MAQGSQIVRHDELVPGMTIQAVTELSLDYAMLDEETLTFVKSAFSGATAVLLDEQGTRKVKVADLQPMEQLQRIEDIPPGSKVAQVQAGMGEFMLKHGLLEFKVVGEASPGKPEAVPAMTPGSAEAKAAHEARREEVKRFMATVEHAATSRERSSSAVEEMLDQGRRGQYSTGGVEAVVDEILKTGSSPAMKAIAGLRGSDQTYAHCTDMSVILQECYVDILTRMGKNPSDTNKRFALVSGFMHDIGKSEVPKDILESTVRFAPDSREMIIMRNHTTYGARILEEMGMPAQTINVAHYHHVKKDSSLLTSYPEAPYDKVLPITRLASIVDVYQALIGKRRYKKNWVPGKAIEHLLKLKDSEFDERMLEQFLESMGRYPVGSMVRLSTGDVGFVLHMAPKDYPDRPVVAVVENAQGERVTHHSLLDLMVEADINVAEVVDHYEHYNESEDQAYNIFASIRVN